MSRFFALALAGIVLSNFQGRVAEARETDREILEIAKREQDVIAIRENHALFKNVRDEFFYGEGGIIKLSEMFVEKASNWMNKWEELGPQVKALNQSYSESQKAVLLGEISALSRAYEEMRSLQSNVSEVVAGGRMRLTGRTALPSDSAKFAQEARSLEVGFASLDEAFVKLDQVVKDKTDVLAQMQGKVLDVIEAMAKRASLSGPSRELNQALDEFAQFIVAEKVAGPMIASVEVQVSSLDKLAQGLWIFRATKQMSSIRSNCKETISAVGSLPGLGTEREKTLGNVQNLCNQAEQRFKNIGGSYSTGQILATAQKMRQRMYSLKCSQSSSSLCKRFDWLPNISAERIQKMNNEQLELLEATWAKFENGTL